MTTNAPAGSNAMSLATLLRDDGYNLSVYCVRDSKWHVVGYRWWLKRGGKTITQGYIDKPRRRQAAIRAAYQAVYGAKA